MMPGVERDQRAEHGERANAFEHEAPSTNSTAATANHSRVPPAADAAVHKHPHCRPPRARRTECDRLGEASFV
jgi:hypothetical protein